jgi:UDP-N-acetylglucosamine/UDP-N-acetylgalactosamine diphosphorylase
MAATIENVLNKLHLSDSLKEPAAEDVQSLRTKFEAVGQGHVFTFWDDLSSTEKAAFYEQLSKFNPERIAVRSRPLTPLLSHRRSILFLFDHKAEREIMQKLSEEALNPPPPAETPVVEPLPEDATASILDSAESSLNAWYDLGLELIGAGQVAVVLMAGMQLSAQPGRENVSSELTVYCRWSGNSSRFLGT